MLRFLQTLLVVLIVACTWLDDCCLVGCAGVAASGSRRLTEGDAYVLADAAGFAEGALGFDTDCGSRYFERCLLLRLFRCPALCGILFNSCRWGISRSATL